MWVEVDESSGVRLTKQRRPGYEMLPLRRIKRRSCPWWDWAWVYQALHGPRRRWRRELQKGSRQSPLLSRRLGVRGVRCSRVWHTFAEGYSFDMDFPEHFVPV